MLRYRASNAVTVHTAVKISTAQRLEPEVPGPQGKVSKVGIDTAFEK